MARALPFPRHKHPPVRATLAQALGSAASQAAAAAGEDQGTPGEVAEQTEASAPSGEEPKDGG